MLRMARIANKGRRRTEEEFLAEFAEKRPDLEYLGGYSSYSRKVKVRKNLEHAQDNMCDHEWEATPKNLFNRHSSCPICAIEKRSKEHFYTQEEFEELIAEKFPNLEIISKYEGSQKPVTYRCKNCGEIFKCKKAISLTSGRTKTHVDGCGTSTFPSMTPENIQKDFSRGLTRGEIAIKYGCTTRTVSNRLAELGLYYRTPRKNNKND